MMYQARCFLSGLTDVQALWWRALSDEDSPDKRKMGITVEVVPEFGVVGNDDTLTLTISRPTFSREFDDLAMLLSNFLAYWSISTPRQFSAWGSDDDEGFIDAVTFIVTNRGVKKIAHGETVQSVSIGDDYSRFFVDQTKEIPLLGATLLSIVGRDPALALAAMQAIAKGKPVPAKDNPLEVGLSEALGMASKDPRDQAALLLASMVISRDYYDKIISAGMNLL